MRKIERRHMFGNSNISEFENQKAKQMFGPSHKIITMLPYKINLPEINSLQQLKQNNEKNEKKVQEFGDFVLSNKTGTGKINDEVRLRTLDIRSNSLQTISTKNSLLKEHFLHRQKEKKQHFNQNAEMETQQVSQISYVKKTTGNDFSLKKILDFKSTLKRRYFFTKNVIKIFKIWSQTEKGKIFWKDIEQMSSKLGLPLNESESKILLSTITKGRKDFANGEDFCELLYNDNFFNYLICKNFADLEDRNPQEINEFVQSKAEVFDEQQRFTRFDFSLMKKLECEFKNQVTGNPINLNLDDFLSYSKKSLNVWTVESENHFKEAFQKYGRSGFINLKSFWEQKKSELDFSQPTDEEIKEKVFTNNECELAFYKQKSKIERPINVLESNFKKIMRVQ